MAFLGRRVSELEKLATQVLVASEKVGEARQALAVAVELVGAAGAAAGQVLTGANDQDAGYALTALANATTDTSAIVSLLEKFEATLQNYLQHIGADSMTTMPPGQSGLIQVPAHAAMATQHKEASQAVPNAKAVPGQWAGKTATHHVRDEGSAIGRAPGWPTKRPIREVRSVSELDELFKSLSAGGRELNEPSYSGSMVLLPDGTRIGYRMKSRTSPHPTIDIRSADRRMLKVHVNGQGWD